MPTKLSPPKILHDLIDARVSIDKGDASAIVVKNQPTTYAQLWNMVEGIAEGLTRNNVTRYDRIALFLPKQIETVVSIFGASLAGCVAVPINPVLKAPQVAYILDDSDAKVLVTSSARLRSIASQLNACLNLRWIVCVDELTDDVASLTATVIQWSDLCEPRASSFANRPRIIDSDMAAILYTSGSTGKPKGVVLNHRNLVVGAQSVADYLENDEHDRILSLLPLSFDAGLSQLTTAFASGAQVVLLDYLLPRDVVRTCEQHAITGITGVPPLWMQLAEQPWTEGSASGLRYFANTGGKMPNETLKKLRSLFCNAKPYLMYGLTEAFRSTYLPPDQVDHRPDSIGKAIPNAEVLVVRPDGSHCDPGEHGELVHRGPLVSLGYWKDPERTKLRFRPAPGQPDGLPWPELAVWSGDTVKSDDDGFLYFVGRQDDMIKTSGYRVSPTELEEVSYQSGLVEEAAAVGVPHPLNGQAIVVVVKPRKGELNVSDALLRYYREALPTFMVPARIEVRDSLPRNANGKIDRKVLKAELSEE